MPKAPAKIPPPRLDDSKEAWISYAKAMKSEVSRFHERAVHNQYLNKKADARNRRRMKEEKAKYKELFAKSKRLKEAFLEAEEGRLILKSTLEYYDPDSPVDRILSSDEAHLKAEKELNRVWTDR